MSATETQPLAEPVNEFNDGRKIPAYSWSKSFGDWVKHSLSSEYTDKLMEHRLLSCLPFFPDPDASRAARIIDTDIGNGNTIHELYIENTRQDAAPPVKDIVLVHGYAASLGLFLDNFDRLSSIPGVRVHAVDLLGFGLSSRPKYPNFGLQTVADVRANEDWFIDSLEEWRKRRNIKDFVLIGHSFGGYLSCAYAFKYNAQTSALGERLPNLIRKLVLLSPVGVERHSKSLLHDADLPADQVLPAEKGRENAQTPALELQRELTSNQEDIVRGRDDGLSPQLLQPSRETDLESRMKESRRTQFVSFLWKHNASPFAIVRSLGPIRSKLVSRWTTHRFLHVFYENPEKFHAIHNYMLRVFNGAGSGEYAITRILSFGALARLPLLDRCPAKFAEMGLPSLWVYGDKDWMNRDAGREIVREINDVAKGTGQGPLAEFDVISNAGHHLYLDNPVEFDSVIQRFLRK